MTKPVNKREKVNSLARNDRAIINERKECAICRGNIAGIIDLPDLPITGVFSKSKPVNHNDGIDQALLWCQKCGHGQLYRQINPLFLYDSNNYSFKTSVSATAREGVNKFLSFLKKVSSKKKKFNCVLDVGCNDLYLLESLGSLGDIRIGIDPIWDSNKPENIDKSITVLGGTVEETDLNNALPCKPDLVLCRHTIEHIYDPTRVLNTLIECSADDALFLFEFPSFESLIDRLRFDQIFHEHLHYFSRPSFEVLLANCSATTIEYTENYHDWGSLLIAFHKEAGSKKKYRFPFSEENISQRLNLFRSQLENTHQILLALKDTSIYGYGAALMLPVLAYHLKSDLSFLAGIIDDDINKDGIYYQNLPAQILHSSKVKNFEELSILITAVDNVKPIMTKLLSFRPRHIIYPFNFI
jgi:hypothetical protein